MIYAKIDWYSVIINNVSIYDVMEQLQIPMDDYIEFCSRPVQRSQGFSTDTYFSVNGVTCSISSADYFYNISQSQDVFTTPVTKLKLDISGTGLDYLRGMYDVDRLLSDPNFWGEGLHHLTRCDFAFDFINYQPTFLDDLIFNISDMIKSGALPNQTRLDNGRSGGVTFQLNLGKAKTVYFGADRSDRKLRIYDKKLERSKNGIFVNNAFEFKEDPVINSWFRIELQTRNKSAHNLIYSYNNDLKNILRVVFEDYCIRDDTGHILECIEKLYNWDTLPPIIQNRNSVQLAPVLERSIRYIEGQAFASIVTFISRYGFDSFKHFICECLDEIFTRDDFCSLRRSMNISKRISTMMIEEELLLSDLKGFKELGLNNYLV